MCFSFGTSVKRFIYPPGLVDDAEFCSPRGVRATRSLVPKCLLKQRILTMTTRACTWRIYIHSCTYILKERLAKWKNRNIFDV